MARSRRIDVSRIYRPGSSWFYFNRCNVVFYICWFSNIVYPNFSRICIWILRFWKVSILFDELEVLKNFSQISSILTSGCSDSALKGKDTIIKIIDNYLKYFNIIVAGKITNHNFLEIHSLVRANEYHGRKIVGSLTV